jgi:hypothetical protein
LFISQCFFQIKYQVTLPCRVPEVESGLFLSDSLGFFFFVPLPPSFFSPSSSLASPSSPPSPCVAPRPLSFRLVVDCVTKDLLSLLRGIGTDRIQREWSESCVKGHFATRFELMDVGDFSVPISFFYCFKFDDRVLFCS